MLPPRALTRPPHRAPRMTGVPANSSVRQWEHPRPSCGHSLILLWTGRVRSHGGAHRARASVALRVCVVQVVMWPRRALLVLCMRWWHRGRRCRWAAVVRVETPARWTKPQVPRRNSPLCTTHVAASIALHHGTQPCRWAAVAYVGTPPRLATPPVPRRNSALCATRVVPWLALHYGTQPRARALYSLVVHYIATLPALGYSTARNYTQTVRRRAPPIARPTQSRAHSSAWRGPYA